jgi:tRNA pseudouridine55 synthase
VNRQRRGGRDVNGVLLLDKPAGLTSNQALQQAKRLFAANKAGHTGSLDPIATGLLPLCFGEATKISQFLLDADKRYRTTLRLGQRTSTGDLEGEVVSERPVDVSDRDVERALAGFRGPILQVPPMHSAIKRQGQPLYKLARKGVELELEPRPVTVYALTLVAYDAAAGTLELDLDCSRGFYVRSLARDLGEALGCGAHVATLRRIGVGGFDVADAVTLAALEQEPGDDPARLDRYLVEPDRGIDHLPGVQLSPDAAYYLCQGQPVRAADAPREGWVRLYGEQSRFLGVGQMLDDGRVAPKRLFHAG